MGPVVQSIVNLTSSLRVISLTVLVDSIYSILIFFAENCKSYSHFFSKKFQHICVSLDVNFNESLTNNVVSFEQLGSGVLQHFQHYMETMKAWERCCAMKSYMYTFMSWTPLLAAFLNPRLCNPSWVLTTESQDISAFLCHVFLLENLTPTFPTNTISVGLVGYCISMFLVTETIKLCKNANKMVIYYAIS